MNNFCLCARTLILALAMFLPALVQAQVCPNPTPFAFDGLNGNGLPSQDNRAILNVNTRTDSSDAANSDNTAHVGLGEALTITFEDARVPAGSPFAISLSLGVLSTAIGNPVTIDGLVWLDVFGAGNLFNIIDGIGFGGIPNPFATTAGPGFENSLFLNVGNDANLNGMCITVQALVLDPAAPAPFFLSFSNPIAVGFQPTIQASLPSFGPAGNFTVISAAGANPSGGDTITFAPMQTTVTQSSGLTPVPSGAISGQMIIDANGVPGIASDDEITDYFAVTDTVTVTTPGLLTTTLDPAIPIISASRATGIATLASSGSSDFWTINLNPGDIIDIEVYSINGALTRLLDGRGNAADLFATEGFDPNVALQVASNLDPLIFDAATGVQNLHFDDDSGPANNAHLRWQARFQSTYNIIVSDSDPSSFVSGGYLLNVRVTSGSPVVQGFVDSTSTPVATATRINIVPQGGAFRIVGPNFLQGRFYDVTLRPRVGAPFVDRVVTSLSTATNGELLVSLPAATVGQLPIGLHQVVVTELLTAQSGMVWDNSQFSPVTGVLPDLLCIRGATTTTAVVNAATGNVTMIGNQNNESVLFRPPVLAPTMNLGNGFVQATDPGGSTVAYAEALGVNESNFDLFDSNTAAGTANGIYNPIISNFYPTLAVPGPYNDDDGLLPFPTFGGQAAGIGHSAAYIDFDGPQLFPAGGNYLYLIRENIIFGPTANHACLVNIVFM
ncbi:MAG: hypothetical protein V3W41_08050 [Planctomycetota bacterium]